MKIFCSVLLLAFTCLLQAQTKPDIKIQLITAELIGEATVDKEKLVEYLTATMTGIETVLADEKADQDILVVFTFHQTGAATLQTAARPELPAALQKKLLAEIKKTKTINTKFVDFSLAFMVRLNNGGNEEADFMPQIKMPLSIEMESFQAKDLKGKRDDLQKWVKTEVIPMIAHFTVNVEDKFAGVQAVGKILKDQTFLSKNVNDLTDKNMDYWRAILEMESGNQIIPFAKVCMHIANGEFGQAQQTLFFADLFSNEKTLLSHLYEELNGKLGSLIGDLNAQINEGLKLHDAGKYKEAIAHYEKIKKIIPKSAWVNYEIYYSKTATMTDKDKIDAEWFALKPTLYEYEPMYQTDVRARNREEGFLMARRMELGDLFAVNDSLKADILQYADIALDLKNYGIAAQCYWYIFNFYETAEYDNRHMLAHFLYCLNKMGDTTLISNFKSEIKDEFPKIEQERQTLKEENVFYKAMKE